MRTKLLIFAIASSTIFMSGCFHRLGYFTVASTHNVKNLNYSNASGGAQHVDGKSCIHYILFIPVGHYDDRIQRAMDDAIANGQDRGLAGDLLVNVRMDLSTWSVLIYGKNCVNVEGDLVSVNK